MDWLLNHDLSDLFRTGAIALLPVVLICVILRGVARMKAEGKDDEQELPADANQPRATVWARVVSRQCYRRTWFVTFEVESGERMTLPYDIFPLPNMGEEGMLTLQGARCLDFERLSSN